MLPWIVLAVGLIYLLVTLLLRSERVTEKTEDQEAPDTRDSDQAEEARLQVFRDFITGSIEHDDEHTET